MTAKHDKPTPIKQPAPALRYVGNGRFFIGIPARDMDAEEVMQLPKSASELIASGIYEVATEEAEHD